MRSVSRLIVTSSHGRSGKRDWSHGRRKRFREYSTEQSDVNLEWQKNIETADRRMFRPRSKLFEISIFFPQIVFTISAGDTKSIETAFSIIYSVLVGSSHTAVAQKCFLLITYFSALLMILARLY